MVLVAVLILMVHLAWLALVIFGAFWTRGRPVCSALHILALLWGIVVEVSPWPCPLTLADSTLNPDLARLRTKVVSCSTIWTRSCIPTFPAGS